MNELNRLTAAELAAKIHSRELSAVEVAQAHLDRIAAVDGSVHAFLHVASQAALASAALVDASLAAGTPPASPLAGVPLALKDVFTTSDMPTTAGSKILQGWRPPYDATVTTSSARTAGDRRSWARPTWTSSRWARRPSTRPSAPPTTRGT